MDVLESGTSEMLGWHDPDENRKWVSENKPRGLVDKRMPVSEAVTKFVKDGDFITSGGFGHIRVSMDVIYELIRQKKRHLAMAGKTAVHDADILIGAGVVDRIDVAYTFGYELRGLTHASRRAVKEGKCKVVGEISNGGYQWRFLAASMGLPFVPTRMMAGSDTFKRSCAKKVKDPFSGKPIVLLPAAYPDAVFIHVPRCDKWGNCQIDGIMIEDFELARAARRLIITTEKVVGEDVIRKKPDLTKIPYFLVDAVCEVPFGAHPCAMPYMYYFDEYHIAEWLDLSKTDEGVNKYLEKYVFGVKDHADYLKKIGGKKKLKQLAKIEHFETPLEAPWIKKE